MSRCAACGGDEEIYARGLGRKCYDFIQRAGRLAEFPARNYRRRADVLEDWAVLKGRGLSIQAASKVMGYAPKSLERILARARSRSES